MQTPDHADYKSPDQIAEATRQAVRDVDGADAYTSGIDHEARPAGQRTRTLMDDLRQTGQRLRAQGGHYVADQPVRAMVMAAAGGAALTTLMLAALRGHGRH